jgi:hypothetical protein
MYPQANLQIDGVMYVAEQYDDFDSEFEVLEEE